MSPERFKSDTSFAAEVLHVVRREAKAGRSFTVGKRSTVSYRLVSGRVRDMAAAFIVAAFGSPSLAVAQAETKRLDAVEAKAREQREAMAAIA